MTKNATWYGAEHDVAGLLFPFAMIEVRGGYEMNIKQTEIRLRYIGKTGYHGLKHWKVYAVSIVSMYGKLWVEV